MFFKLIKFGEATQQITLTEDPCVGKALGMIDLDAMDVSINGKMATSETEIKPDDTVVVAPKTKNG
jgi:hypothetical protein